MKHRIATISCLCAILLITSQIAFAQNAAVTEKRAAKSTPIYSSDVPGIGPIRAEDWFVKGWNERRSHFRELEPKQHGAIVFFGDSITQGWSDDFRGKFPKLNVANRGISGDTTRGLLARMDEDVLSLDPRAIVLLIGTNDIGIGLSPEDIAGNIKLLLKEISANNSKVPIVLCLVMPSSEKKDRPADKIQKLNKLLTEAVASNKQVTVVDTYKLFADAEGDAKLEEFPDLLHPNDAGYEKWRAALEPVLDKLGVSRAAPDRDGK
jgi:lysophospholipase L1-like esterase